MGKHVAGMYGALFAVAITLFLFNRTGSDVVTPGLIAAMSYSGWLCAIIYTLYSADPLLL